jgi:hypothetical protein
LDAVISSDSEAKAKSDDLAEVVLVLEPRFRSIKSQGELISNRQTVPIEVLPTSDVLSEEASKLVAY